MNPRKSTAAAAGVLLSGFLPSNSLLESLLRVSDEVAASANAPTPLFLQSRNIASAARRIRLLSPLFDDLRHATAPLPPPAILCLTELYSIVRRIKAVIDALGSGSALWGLLQTESYSRQFYSCTKELGRALDILPLSGLDVTADAREQVELAHRQLKRAEVFVGRDELRLREELIEAMGKNYKDGDDDRRDHLNNWEKMEAIMRTLGVRSALDYDEEIRRLEAEIPKQAGTGGVVAVSNIYGLLALVRLSKAMMFGNSSSSSSSSSTSELVKPEAAGTAMAATGAGASSSLLCNSIEMSIPDEFRCPITLDLMRDPVIVSSGHTYDRSSIARWLDSGRHSCPKSGRRLIHTAVIPNYAVKGLMEQWCRDHNVAAPFWDEERGRGGEGSVDHIAAARAAADAVRMTAEFLVGKLATGSREAQRQAAYEVRLLAKTGMDNRRIIAEAGAIPFLVTLLGSADARTQEDAVTALLNLSIHYGTKALIVSAPGAADAIVGVMRRGAAAEARENAAAALFSLSIPEEHRGAVAARPGRWRARGAPPRGEPAGSATRPRRCTTSPRAAAAAERGSSAAAAAAAEAGAVGPLVGLLTDGAAGVADEALALLVALCGCEAGRRGVGGERGLVPILVEVVREGTERGKENAVSLLLGLCRDGEEEVGRRLLANPRSVPALQRLTVSGSPRARRKADALLRLLNTYCIQSLNPIG
ncbi:U-box domain-containing protein 17 [Ananas comosus]|uniref:RING-type E3 ubiquitin transferase n=1 Tax=Ananas comosus TaxID=4615 RepID=A0A199UXB7_ANACO|nr:U-box domain-containing protein 17 [Ananas comosus]